MILDQANIPLALLGQRVEDLPARLCDIVRYWNAVTPNAPALCDRAEIWTYADLWSAVEAGVTLLRDIDVRPGDRVMLVGENCAAQVALIFAAAALDAWIVIVNARLSSTEIATIRDHCEPRRTLYLSAVSADADAHAQRHDAAFFDAGLLGKLAIGTLNSHCIAEPVVAANAEQVAALIYTTGTTGTPKGVMLTHRNLLFVAAGSAGLRHAEDRVYGLLPISHVFGLASVMLATLYAGACLYLAQRYSPKELLASLEHDGITVLLGVPAMYAHLLELCQKSDVSPKAPNLRLMYAGGSPLDPALKKTVEKMFGMPLHNGYGQTETSPSVSHTQRGAPRSDTSVGEVIEGIEIRIVDQSHGAVTPGQTGELWVRGPNVMKGYYRAPELTASVLRADGWLNTGDLARQNPDGALFIAGRTKELIIRSGFNVYPVEIEAALNAHAAVTQSAVVGRQVTNGNEEVVAFVELNPQHPVSVTELQGYLANLLSPYKCPSEIIVMHSLPAAATGKLLKGELKKMAQQTYDGRQIGNKK